MIIKTIIHNSVDYFKMIELRMEVLLKPAGMPSFFINQQKEKEDILIAAFEDEMIGCCVLTPISAATAQLRQMAVKKNLQGVGIGAAIIKYPENLTKEKGDKIIMMHALDVVIPFYKKCGYQVYDEFFTEAGMSHHKMRKQLL